MPEQDRDKEKKEVFNLQFVWQIWVSEPLNKEADLLVRWSRTSFFGGGPVSEPRVFDGKEYVLFHKCSEESMVKYALANALPNFRYVKLTRLGEETSLETYVNDLHRPSGNLLGEAASMDRSGGMC